MLPPPVETGHIWTCELANSQLSREERERRRRRKMEGERERVSY